MYYLIKFLKIPTLEKKLLIIGILLKIRFLITTSLVSPRYYRRIFNLPHKHNLSYTMNSFYLMKIKRTIKRVNKLLPFRDNCMINVLIASRLLRLFGIYSRIEFELIKNESSFIEAHAYLSQNNVPIYLFDWKRKHYNVRIN